MKDQLSALIDGEMVLDDAQHLLTGLGAGGELKEAWQHYHLIGDAMRGDTQVRIDLTARIMTAIENEPTVLAPSAVKANAPSRTSSWAFPKVWSIAASVAAVMFVGAMVWQHQSLQTDDLAPVQIAQDVPVEYLAAHHAAAPSGVSYYIQPATYSESR
ncbi:MAG TPA: sigma-E factor negative regulatory protein [Methylophilus sp.]|nr:sigma-E factor negative regulatory protein [Methylophilus sp.]HQQ33542.1 sigma-E factor negative regulatory protein [Methylophilus sp.]